ncbi:UNVERIFIED_ORG: putative ATPase [Peribacillus simplex]
MRLSYIYVEEYGKMKKLELNFDPVIKYNYHFKDKKLIVQKNKNFIKSFFDSDERVKNITAIIGANGSGKTSTLELIKDIYSKKEIFSNGKFILIFTEEKSNIQTSHIYYHSSLIEKFKEDEVNVVKHPYFTEILQNGAYDTVELSNVKTPCIFFSNIFDGLFEQEITSDSGKQLYNISTNFLVRKDEEYWKEDSKKKGIGQINSYNASSVLRHVRFISEFNHLNLNFELPQYLYIRLRNFSGVKRANNLPEFLRQTINDVLSNDQVNKDLIFKFIHSMINSYFDELIDYKKIDKFTDQFWGDYPEIKDDDLEPLNKIIQILEKWIEELKRVRMIKDGTIAIHDNEVQQVNAMIKLIKLCKRKNQFALGLDRKGLRIQIKNDLQFLETFIANFFSSFQFRAYATFEWSNSFSSGQKAMIDLYSRFYSIAWEVNRIESQHILIIIDEGELYLHPQWQKAFINNIIKFYTDLFPGKIIQIVLTSNSPILLSDLPKDCVMFLEEMNGEIQITDGLRDKNQTFAANIHSLFSDSFFLKGDLIGDFAKQRINWLINILNSDIEMIRDKEEVVRKMINIIGEPIIKNKLINMLEDQLKVKLINVDKEIEDLKERINKLENQKRS